MAASIGKNGQGPRQGGLLVTDLLEAIAQDIVVVVLHQDIDCVQNYLGEEVCGARFQVQAAKLMLAEWLHRSVLDCAPALA